MSHHSEENPDAFEYLSSGGLSVQLGNSNPFERVPVDQTCEERVNKETQTSGGTKGFRLKTNSSKHTDLQCSRITLDETDVKNIILLLQDTGLDSFHLDLQDPAKLKAFTDLNKKIKAKASNNQEVVLKAEKRLFAQMIVIAECRNLQMSEDLAHSLGPLPWTLAKPDGTSCKTNNAFVSKGTPEECTSRRCYFPTTRMLNRWHGFNSASKEWPENIC